MHGWRTRRQYELCRVPIMKLIHLFHVQTAICEKYRWYVRNGQDILYQNFWLLFRRIPWFRNWYSQDSPRWSNITTVSNQITWNRFFIQIRYFTTEYIPCPSSRRPTMPCLRVSFVAYGGNWKIKNIIHEASKSVQ